MKDLIKDPSPFLGGKVRQVLQWICIQLLLGGKEWILSVHKYICNSCAKFMYFATYLDVHHWIWAVIIVKGVVPAPRVELGTWWLQINCSTNWAIPAKKNYYILFINLGKSNLFRLFRNTHLGFCLSTVDGIPLLKSISLRVWFLLWCFQNQN